MIGILARLTGALPLKFLGRRVSNSEMCQAPRQFSQDSENNTYPVEVDVLVSLFRFEAHFDRLKESIESNDQIGNTFILVVVSPSQSELEKLRTLQLRNALFKVVTSEERIGIYQAWNLALSLGHGKYVTNLNADDLRWPGSIQALGWFLENKPNEDVAFSDFFIEVTDGRSRERAAHGAVQLADFSLHELVVKGNNFPHCAPVWRRSLHEELGFFDSKLISSGDSEFWLRCLLRQVQFAHFPHYTVCFAWNQGGVSSKLNSPGSREWFGVLKKNQDAVLGALEARP